MKNTIFTQVVILFFLLIIAGCVSIDRTPYAYKVWTPINTKAARINSLGDLEARNTPQVAEAVKVCNSPNLKHHFKYSREVNLEKPDAEPCWNDRYASCQMMKESGLSDQINRDLVIFSGCMIKLGFEEKTVTFQETRLVNDFNMTFR